MHTNRSNLSRHSVRALIAVAGIALVAGCSSGSGTPKSAHNITTTSTTIAAATTTSVAEAPTPTTSVTAPAATTVTTQATTIAAAGPNVTGQAETVDDFAVPCALVTTADVQAVLPNAPEGEEEASTATFSQCAWTGNAGQRVTIALGTSGGIEAIKDGAAQQPGVTKVEGLGDAAYASITSDRIGVHFFRGNTELLVTGDGTVGGTDAIVALARQVNAAL
jgi:hypothetical protein